ncbi:MAG: hypothetical protein KY455_13705 [Euryarchaeota archaeon]|nr:hypothetical protein [Euryarchaeota archaeon]
MSRRPDWQQVPDAPAIQPSPSHSPGSPTRAAAIPTPVTEEEDAPSFSANRAPTAQVASVVVVGIATLIALAISRAPGSPRLFDVLALALLLRLVGDIPGVAAPRNPFAVGIEGAMRAVSWSVGGVGLIALLANDDPWALAPWMVGAGLALGGLNLYGHHKRAMELSRRLGIGEGTAGAFAAAVGLPLALSGALDGPAGVLLPGLVLVVGVAVALTTSKRLLHSEKKTKKTDVIGWNAWFQEHFFRHMLILAAVVAYFFLRDPLRGFIGSFFVPVEYAIGVTLLSLVFLSLRSYLRKRLSEHPLASPHRRHEEVIERQGDPSYDHLDRSVAAFLDRGDTTPMQALSDDLEDRGVPASRHLEPILSYKAPDHITLVHPAWLYGARVAVLFLIALALALFLGDLGGDETPAALESAASAFFLLVFGLGLYLSQANSFGGPWWGRMMIGYAGYLFLFLADDRLGTLTGRASLVSTLPGPTGGIVLIVLALLPLGHLLSRDRTKKPHYAVRQRDPVATIEQLRHETERALVKRFLWLSVMGLIFFVVVGQIASATGADTGFIVNTYLVLALAFLVHPVLLVAGLRLGKEHVARQDRAERTRRKQRYTAAIRDLGVLFAEMRHPPAADERQRITTAPRLGPDGRPTPYAMPPVPSVPPTVPLTGFRPSEAAHKTPTYRP